MAVINSGVNPRGLCPREQSDAAIPPYIKHEVAKKEV